MTKIRFFIKNNGHWFRMINIFLISVTIAVLAILTDWRILPFIDFIPPVFLTTTSMAKTILSTLSGALLTITTFTFSTILTVLSMYASNFTPRIVENFLRKKITMSVLGVYVGGFFYSILSLAFMRERLSDLPVVSGMIGVIYSIVCIIFFIRFVYTVSESLQAKNVIDELTKETLLTIKKSLARNIEDKYGNKIILENGIDIIAAEEGYLGSIDFDELKKHVSEYSGKMAISKLIGEHIIEGDILARISINIPLSDEDYQEILGCFAVQNSQIVTEDYRYGITKVVEIAVRALSPGVNDPNTAIKALDKIGVILSYVSQAIDNRVVMKGGKNFDIFYKFFDLNRDLHMAYEQIIHYGMGDISVVRAIFTSLQVAFNHATVKNKGIIKDFDTYVYENVIGSYTHPVDIAKVDNLRIIGN